MEAAGKNDMPVVIRPMQVDDIAGGMRLSVAEGWNQTEHDWKLFIEGPHNVCMLAECDKKIIGTTTAMIYSDKVAWIGMVLVDKAYRGMGVSRILLESVFAKLNDCKSIKLDATPQGQQVYKKFEFQDEYLIERMVNMSVTNLLPPTDDKEEPLQIQSKDIPEIIAFDKLAFGADRTILIESLIKNFPKKALVLKRNNVVTGFVLGRDGSKYHHIGPVMASSITNAKALIKKTLIPLSDKPVVADVLSDKEDLIMWLNSMGFVKQRHFIRMYKKDNSFPGSRDKHHLICGPEFG